MPAITLPPRLTAEQMSPLVACADAIAAQADLDTLDATGATGAGPVGMVVLALALARRRRRGRGALQLLPPADTRTANFLDEVGLGRMIGGEAGDRRRADTLEIRQMTTHDRLYTERIANVLVERVAGYDADASHLVHLCLNELLQNVFEWSESREGAFVHCRHYRKEANVRIAVADGGIGIPAALRRAATAGLERQPDAAVLVAAASQPGLTSSGKGSRGLGLKLIRDVVTTRGGRLTLASHTALVTFGPGQAVRKKRCRYVRGTVVEVDFRPHVAADEGEAIL